MREAEPRTVSFVSHCETGTQPGGKEASVSATTSPFFVMFSNPVNSGK